ncbi:MAG TPA: tetratricopeptide repeat protein [Vicinamibacterales bacterium]|jgi:tetratricopeptide (TPR) repeat protein
MTALACGIALVTAGCSRESPTSGSPKPASTSEAGREELRPILLPNLAVAAKTVQAQVRDRHAALTATLENKASTDVARGQAYGELGKLLLGGEYFDSAENCFLNAKALMPSEMRWPYYLGHVYRKKGNAAKSAEEFEQALRLNPDHEATRYWLAEMYLTLGRAESAEALLSKSLTLGLRSPAALYGMGRIALSRKNYQEAVKLFEEALSLDPPASILHYPLATAYRGLGQTQQAEEHLRRRGDVNVTTPDPLMQEVNGLLETALAYEERGLRSFETGQWAEAAAYFRKGVELEPENPSVRHKLGTALALMGDNRGAEEQFQIVVRQSPAFAKAHYSLGLLMESSGRRRRAIEEFSLAVQHDSNYVDAHMRLAELLLFTGQARPALAQYERAIGIDPRQPRPRYGYAMALVRLGRYREARDWLNDAIRLHPDQPGFVHALARVLVAAPDETVRDGPRAMTLVQELLRGPQTLELGETMAMTLAELGQYGDAVALQRKVLSAARQEGRQDLVATLTTNLQRYERQQPCRVPWIVEPEFLTSEPS